MKLKSVLIASAVMFCLIRNSSAQFKTEIGVKGGLNISGLALGREGKLSGASYSNLKGFHFGAYALLKTKKVGIQPEILFSQQGQYYNITNYSNLRTDLSYLNIPVMIKYYLVGGLHLQAGGQFAFLLSAKGDIVQTTTGGTIQAIMLNQDLKSYMNSTDFAFAFGAGVDIPFGLNLGIRYNIGQTNINKYHGAAAGASSSNSPSFSVASAHNQVFQLTVGYRFLKLGK